MFITALESLFAGASTLEERCDRCREAGFDGLDLREHAGDAANARDLARERGLRIGMIYSALPLPLLSPTVHQRAAALELLRGKIRAAAEAEALGVVVVPVFGPPRITVRYAADIRTGELTLLEILLRELEPALAEEGVYLALEPLNRDETHLLQSPVQAADFLRRTQLSGVRTMADIYHMDREGQDPGEQITGARDYLGCIHLAGRNRTPPAAGPIDFPGAIQALKTVRYDGPLGFECRPTPVPDLAQSVAYIRSLLAAER